MNTKSKHNTYLIKFGQIYVQVIQVKYVHLCFILVCFTVTLTYYLYIINHSIIYSEPLYNRYIFCANKKIVNQKQPKGCILMQWYKCGVARSGFDCSVCLKDILCSGAPASPFVSAITFNIKPFQLYV